MRGRIALLGAIVAGAIAGHDEDVRRARLGAVYRRWLLRRERRKWACRHFRASVRWQTSW